MTHWIWVLKPPQATSSTSGTLSPWLRQPRQLEGREMETEVRWVRSSHPLPPFSLTFLLGNTLEALSVRVVLSHLSCVQIFVTLWTTARQAPLSMGFSRQEYWSGLPQPLPGDLPNQGLNLGLLYCKQVLSH